MANRQHLEQAPHAIWFGQTARRFDQRQGLGGWLGSRQPAGAFEQAEARQEDALRERSVRCRPGFACDVGKRGEIYMRGEIGGARCSKRIGGTAVADRLEAVTWGTVFRAVVEAQAGAWALGEACTQRADKSAGGLADLDGAVMRAKVATRLAVGCGHGKRGCRPSWACRGFR